MGIRPPGHEAVQGERVKPWPAMVGTIRKETGGLAPEMQCIYNTHVPANRSRPSSRLQNAGPGTGSTRASVRGGHLARRNRTVDKRAD